jgi:hypothetical protein
VRDRESEVNVGRARHDGVVLILDRSCKENADRMVTGRLDRANLKPEAKESPVNISLWDDQAVIDYGRKRRGGAVQNTSEGSAV